MLFRCRMQVCRVTWCGTGPQLQPEQRAVCSRARQNHRHYHIVFRLDHSNQKSGRLMPQNLVAEPKSTLRWRTLAQGAAPACAPPAPSAALLGTARSWRGIVPSTHLAREGRMTVTIGRRELLAAFGGVAVAWPLAARAQQSQR